MVFCDVSWVFLIYHCCNINNSDTRDDDGEDEDNNDDNDDDDYDNDSNNPYFSYAETMQLPLQPQSGIRGT